ncbi:MAG TPA: hypothetical protein VFD58_18555 [Blastocatellia bacterium]|nr:hypothetical protein [Blastocatellia bacterium]
MVAKPDRPPLLDQGAELALYLSDGAPSDRQQLRWNIRAKNALIECGAALPDLLTAIRECYGPLAGWGMLDRRQRRRVIRICLVRSLARQMISPPENQTPRRQGI